MKYIFITHSNITSIVINETVESLLNNSEKVIIITRRGVSWPIINNETIIDFSNKTISSLLSLKAIKHIFTLSKCVDSIINKEDFILYLPTSYDEVYYSFQKSKFCKGYYYIEEGVLAYKGLKFIREDKNLIKRGIKHLLGLYPDFYYFDKRLKGTLSISDKSFKWNQGAKIVNNPYSYFKRVCDDQRSYSHIIVFSYLDEHVSFYKSIIDAIFQNNGGSLTNIAFKFHPRSSYVEPQMKNEITNYILSLFPQAAFLESDYVLEKEILSKVIIICVQVASSVLFYSLLNGNRCYLYKQSKGGHVKEIVFESISDYVSHNPSISL
jgi:hypothetical protein